MDNKQYRNLIWHLSYVESLLENVAIATNGGGYASAQSAKQRFPYFSRSVKKFARMQCAPNANRWNVTENYGY